MHATTDTRPTAASLVACTYIHAMQFVLSFAAYRIDVEEIERETKIDLWLIGCYSPSLCYPRGPDWPHTVLVD
jgi:hypothetical protein